MNVQVALCVEESLSVVKSVVAVEVVAIVVTKSETGFHSSQHQESKIQAASIASINLPSPSPPPSPPSLLRPRRRLRIPHPHHTTPHPHPHPHPTPTILRSGPMPLRQHEFRSLAALVAKRRGRDRKRQVHDPLVGLPRNSESTLPCASEEPNLRTLQWPVRSPTVSCVARVWASWNLETGT